MPQSLHYAQVHDSRWRVNLPDGAPIHVESLDEAQALADLPQVFYCLQLGDEEVTLAERVRRTAEVCRKYGYESVAARWIMDEAALA